MRGSKHWTTVIGEDRPNITRMPNLLFQPSGRSSQLSAKLLQRRSSMQQPMSGGSRGFSADWQIVAGGRAGYPQVGARVGPFIRGKLNESVAVKAGAAFATSDPGDGAA